MISSHTVKSFSFVSHVFEWFLTLLDNRCPMYLMAEALTHLFDLIHPVGLDNVNAVPQFICTQQTLRR